MRRGQSGAGASAPRAPRAPRTPRRCAVRRVGERGALLRDRPPLTRRACPIPSTCLNAPCPRVYVPRCPRARPLHDVVTDLSPTPPLVVYVPLRMCGLPIQRAPFVMLPYLPFLESSLLLLLRVMPRLCWTCAVAHRLWVSAARAPFSNLAPLGGGGGGRARQEHRPQRPTERSDPTQHAEGRTGDCPGPREGATTRRNVTRGGGGGLPLWTPSPLSDWAKLCSGPSKITSKRVC